MRCLLVDDSRAFLETAQAFLAGEGVTVTGAASNGAEALRQARALRPDLVLVDVMLGDENGFDLASRFAGNGAAVIMISSGAEADYADLIAESPAAGFLSKAELSAAGIRRILVSHDWPANHQDHVMPDHQDEGESHYLPKRLKE